MNDLFSQIVKISKDTERHVNTDLPEEFRKPIKDFERLQFELFGICTGIVSYRLEKINQDWDFEKLCSLILALFSRTL